LALDVHKLVPRKTKSSKQSKKLMAGRHLLAIDDAAMQILTPAFEQLRARTGQLIDAYTDCVLSDLDSLIQILEQRMPPLTQRSGIWFELLSVLRQARAEGYGVMFAGD